MLNSFKTIYFHPEGNLKLSLQLTCPAVGTSIGNSTRSSRGVSVPTLVEPW